MYQHMHKYEGVLISPKPDQEGKATATKLGIHQHNTLKLNTILSPLL
jgi:hypothetical protein